MILGTQQFLTDLQKWWIYMEERQLQQKLISGFVSIFLYFERTSLSPKMWQRIHSSWWDLYFCFCYRPWVAYCTGCAFSLYPLVRVHWQYKVETSPFQMVPGSQRWCILSLVSNQSFSVLKITQPTVVLSVFNEYQFFHGFIVELIHKIKVHFLITH